jgi:Hemerythrin HHE cation binding domain
LAAILEDHARITLMFTALTEASTADEREKCFGDLLRKLMVHETAEQEVVYPLAREASGGGPLVQERPREEKGTEHLLKSFEGTEPDAPDFAVVLDPLHAAVLEHVVREEREEFPMIEQAKDGRQPERLATLFRAAERSAPTRPRRRRPTSASPMLVAGPMLDIAGRARNAVVEARGVLLSVGRCSSPTDRQP